MIKMSETKKCLFCGHDQLYFIHPMGFFCQKCNKHQRDESPITNKVDPDGM